MQKTVTTCEHGDADRIVKGECGGVSVWECAGFYDDCGETFEQFQPHDVIVARRHAEDCERKRIPAEWCVCETVRSAVCTNCDAVFTPKEAKEREDIVIWN